MARQDKHQPQEISSKQPVSLIRQVVEPLRKKALDPRFDRSFGKFNADLFHKSYGFLDDMNKRETVELQDTLRRERDPYRHSQIEEALKRRHDRERNFERHQHEQQVLREHRQRDLQLVARGRAAVLPAPQRQEGPGAGGP